MNVRHVFYRLHVMARLRLATLALLLALVGLVVGIGTTPVAKAATF